MRLWSKRTTTWQHASATLCSECATCLAGAASCVPPLLHLHSPCKPHDCVASINVLAFGPPCTARHKQSDARLAVEDANKQFYDAFASGRIEVRLQGLPPCRQLSKVPYLSYTFCLTGLHRSSKMVEKPFCHVAPALVKCRHANSWVWVGLIG